MRTYLSSREAAESIAKIEENLGEFAELFELSRENLQLKATVNKLDNDYKLKKRWIHEKYRKEVEQIQTQLNRLAHENKELKRQLKNKNEKIVSLKRDINQWTQWCEKLKAN